MKGASELEEDLGLRFRVWGLGLWVSGQGLEVEYELKMQVFRFGALGLASLSGRTSLQASEA